MGAKELNPSIFEISVAFHATAHPLASHCLFHAFAFAGLEINGVLFDFFDNRFLLHFPLETLKGALDRFAFINDYEGHGGFTSSLGEKEIIPVPPGKSIERRPSVRFRQ